MKTDLNSILITTILENIPKNMKTVSFLMDALQLSRESVYRRIRGEISFSVEEVALLSTKLGFSIDEMLGKTKIGRAFFDLLSINTNESSEVFLNMLKRYHSHIEAVINSENGKIIMALNRLPPTFHVFFDNLFKFVYYKWLHQNDEISSKHPFSSVEIFPDLYSIQEKIQIALKTISNISLIFDPNVFLGMIRDIQYFYQRRLICSEELDVLKNEMFMLIDFYENIAKTGTIDNNRAYIYLSPLYINANTCYVNLDQYTSQSIFWIMTVNPMFVSNQDVCLIHKRWLSSLQRQSILITLSNEILQAEFFDKQRKYVEKYLNNPISVILQ
jgi:hypothetical protein